MGTHTGGSPHPMRARARETVVIGKFTTRRSQTAGFGKTRAAFSDRASSSWSRDSDLDLVKLVPGCPRPALIVYRVAGPAIVI